MNVTFICPEPSNRGGIANWVRLISDYTRRKIDGFTFDYIFTKPYSSQYNNFFGKFIKNGFDIKRIIKELKAKIKQHKIDVLEIEATGQWSTIRDLKIIKICKRNSIKIVYHTHFGDIPDFKRKNNFFWKKIKKILLQCDALWSMDRYTLEVLKNDFPKLKKFFMPNPICLEELPICEKQEKYISFVGLVIERKGIKELLKAWDLICDKFPDYYLKIIGPCTDAYFNELKTISNFKRVEFVGRMPHDEAMVQLAKSKIFVLPAHSEGFPYVLLEAMGLKKPIISTDCGGIKEMLSENSGVIIEPYSVNQLVDAMSKLLKSEDIQKTISENAYKRVKTNYSIENVFTMYKNSWKSLL